MSDLHHLLKARFKAVRQDLDQVLSRFTDEEFGWGPGHGMHTVGGLVLEIADKDREAVIWMKTGVWPDDEPPSFDLERTNLEEARAKLEAIRQTTLAYIDSMTEAELESPVQCPEGWWEALRLTACPRSEVLRNIASHEWYHTGQLVIYRGLLGDNLDTW